MMNYLRQLKFQLKNLFTGKNTLAYSCPGARTPVC